ncbi:MAG: glycosyltransferase family 4 protein [Ruminococcaceae bacterium]|nr:glycosyltransferase family 4 protein [Oscillospiraceae bacterium]
MKLVFASNYFNHHQKPLSDAFYSLLGDDYAFIETAAMEEERVKLGWGGIEKPSYVKQNYTDESSAEACQTLIDNADIVIHGSAPYNLLLPRLEQGKITFKYSERKYKNGCPFYKLPRHFLINNKKYRRYKNFYILCASAYTSADYKKTLTFMDKAYRWGYFTEVKEYDPEKLIEKKRPASILWVARLIELKHPEAAVEVAKRLKADGYSFEMNLIGNGELEDRMKSLIKEYDLDDSVHMLGSMPPEKVREHMEKSEIFLFNSDKREGWGAVANESMNSCCAVVASHAIGCVPFLIEDGVNGFIYKDGNIDDLYSKVKFLLDNPEERKEIAFNAYFTMKNEWNAENAAKKFIEQAQKILAGEEISFIHEKGVCSKAEYLKDNWIYKK